MEFVYLDLESEKLLKMLLIAPTNTTIRGSAAENLIQQGFIKGMDIRSLSDLEPVYMFQGITQKGKTYFSEKEEAKKEKRRLSSREWWIAIISAIIGALLPTIIEWISIALISSKG